MMEVSLVKCWSEGKDIKERGEGRKMKGGVQTTSLSYTHGITIAIHALYGLFLRAKRGKRRALVGVGWFGVTPS